MRSPQIQIGDDTFSQINSLHARSNGFRVGFFGIESSKFSLINTKRLISWASRHLLELHFEYFSRCAKILFCVEVQWQRFRSVAMWRRWWQKPHRQPIKVSWFLWAYYDHWVPGKKSVRACLCVWFAEITVCPRKFHAFDTCHMLLAIICKSCRIFKLSRSLVLPVCVCDLIPVVADTYIRGPHTIHSK